jgi:hypothetical protein
VCGGVALDRHLACLFVDGQLDRMRWVRQM